MMTTHSFGLLMLTCCTYLGVCTLRILKLKSKLSINMCSTSFKPFHGPNPLQIGERQPKTMALSWNVYQTCASLSVPRYNVPGVREFGESFQSRSSAGIPLIPSTASFSAFLLFKTIISRMIPGPKAQATTFSLPSPMCLSLSITLMTVALELLP